MRTISIILIFNVLSIFLSLNIQAQNVICIGSVTSTSITDFGIKDPSFQTKWNAYLQNRTWKWASGHVTVTKEYVKFYIRYKPEDNIGQEIYTVVEIIKNEQDSDGRNVITFSLKSPSESNYFPSVLLYDEKEWVLTISGIDLIATWKGTIL